MLSEISFGDLENILDTVLETESTKFLVCSLKGLFAPCLCNALDSKAEINVPHREIGNLHREAMLPICNLCQLFLFPSCKRSLFPDSSRILLFSGGEHFTTPNTT